MKMYPRTREERPDSKIQDDESKAMLFEGASISQLAALFGHDNRTITKKIQGIKPIGKRAGHPIYKIAEAAAYLVKPMGDIEEYIKKMQPEDLPPKLSKEFWSAQSLRMKFEEDRNDLWRTSDVVTHFAESFKVARTTIMLTVDSIEKTTELSEAQRNLMLAEMDKLMLGLNKALLERFQHEPDRTFEVPSNGGQADGREEPERTAVEDEPDPAEGL
jgi:Protein of unknown function (DUF1441)